MSKKTEFREDMSGHPKGTYDYSQRSGGTHLVGPEEDDDADGDIERSDTTVVGWLAIIDGPGKGFSCEITFGVNMVGRDASNRIVLDFGDPKISREDHFRIIYDELDRTFDIVPGQSANLVRINNKSVKTLQPLEAMTDIEVGETKLRFVPLCTADWSWGQDQ